MVLTMNMNDFDELDRHIVGFVKHSNGVSIREIAEAVRRPVQTVRYRDLQLEAEGVIRGIWHRRGKAYYVK